MAAGNDSLFGLNHEWILVKDCRWTGLDYSYPE